MTPTAYLRIAAIAALGATIGSAGASAALSGTSTDGSVVWTTGKSGTTTDQNAIGQAMASDYTLYASGATASSRTTAGNATANFTSPGGSAQAGFRRTGSGGFNAYNPNGSVAVGNTFYTGITGNPDSGHVTLTFDTPQSYFGALMNSNAQSGEIVFYGKTGIKLLDLKLDPTLAGVAAGTSGGMTNYAYYFNATFSTNLFSSMTIFEGNLPPTGKTDYESMTNVVTEALIPLDMPYKPGATNLATPQTLVAGGADVPEPAWMGLMSAFALAGMIGVRRARRGAP